jgi:hypothetical protein
VIRGGSSPVGFIAWAKIMVRISGGNPRKVERGLQLVCWMSCDI